MENKAGYYDFFPKKEIILHSLANPRPRKAPVAPLHTELETIGISGNQPRKEAEPLVKTHDVWESEHEARARVALQMEEIYRGSIGEQWFEEEILLNKAKAAIQSCGSAYIVEKEGPNRYKYVSSFHCKRKYCPRCAAKKTSLLIAKYTEFLGSDNKKAAEILQNHDLGFLTITLRHGEGSRSGWYADELATHFRNSLKYGAFNKYIVGGCYQTEVNHGPNGFHIHRHCIVLVPKKYRLQFAGTWTEKDGKRSYKAKNNHILRQLTAAWHQKTKDSFQLDLKPIDPNQHLAKSLSEIFKYLSNGTNEGKGIVAAPIVKELQRNPKQKFYGRFGILHNIKELNISDTKIEEPDHSDDPLHVPPKLYIARALTKTQKGWKFQSLTPINASKDRPAMQILMEKCLYWRSSHTVKAEERTARKYEVHRPVHDF